MGPGDVLLLYTDGVYDGTDKDEREILESIMREHCRQSAREICDALLDYALEKDARLRQREESDLIDDKTVFIVKRT